MCGEPSVGSTGSTESEELAALVQSRLREGVKLGEGLWNAHRTRLDLSATELAEVESPRGGNAPGVRLK